MDQSGEERSKLLEAARELYARLVTAQTAQCRQAATCRRRAAMLRWIDVTLALLTTAAIMITFAPQVPRNPWAPIAAVVLSFLTLGFLLAQVGFDPGRRELEHRLAAGKLGAERGRFLVAISRVATAGTPLVDAQRELEVLGRESALIHGVMREPSERVRRRAAEAVRRGAGSAMSREEVDRLLPEALRQHPESPPAHPSDTSDARRAVAEEAHRPPPAGGDAEIRHQTDS